MSDFDAATWRTELEQKREEKDEFFAEHPQSPIPPEERDDFDGVAYFDPDPSFRVEAELTHHAEPEPVPMETTSGPEVRYVRVATLSFDLDGESYELHGYKQRPGEGQPEPLFVPFRDKTTGQQTYEKGRYMELHVDGDLTEVETVTLDFNLAYSPFCAFSETFSCPLPPEENWLETTVEAGERY
ncbi:DUF1684 domain-containing protein [Haloarchaeobius sp. TZWSO28]|uniref:DUF1684 domain-containing protein n=1 Tax=unclassified Haloarchaeobius TaxID=2614452 RepID=UPI003EBB6446